MIVEMIRVMTQGMTQGMIRVMTQGMTQGMIVETLEMVVMVETQVDQMTVVEMAVA
jgi:hypothetical protein